MKLFRVWWEDSHGFSLIMAEDEDEACALYEALDPGEQGTPAGVEVITEVTGRQKARHVLSVE